MSSDLHSDVDLRVELRVLYGPQAGSRLTLAEGEYLLGSSDSCTIILAGPKIVEEHAILTLEGEEIAIQPLDGEISDAQGNEIAESMPLALGQAIELGGIWIAIDDQDAEWPDLHAIAPAPGRHAVPEEPEAETLPDEPVVQGAGDDSLTASEQQQHQRDGDTEDTEAAQRAQPAGELLPVLLPPARVPLWKSHRMLAAAGAFGVLVLVAGAAWMMGMMAEDARDHRAAVLAAVTPPVLMQPKPVPPATITAYLKTLPYGKALSVTRDDAGDWSVTGYVRTNADRQELTDGLASLTPAAVPHVTVDEDLVAAANRYLATRVSSNAMVRAESSTAGVVRLGGGAADAAAVETVMRELRASVPGIRKIESQVAMPQQLRERLRARIADAGLDKRLSYVQEAPEVVLSGRLNNEETARWEALLVQFSREFGNLVPIRASIGNGNPAVIASDGTGASGNRLQRLPVGVQAIVSGPVPYIVTSRGERINQGGEIDGQTLLSVRDGEVVFEGKRRIRIVR